MTMTGKERAELRSECNRLKPLVHIGEDGLSGTLIAALNDALRTRELVKVQLNKNAEVSAKAAANDLAKRVKAEVMADTLGVVINEGLLAASPAAQRIIVGRGFRDRGGGRVSRSRDRNRAGTPGSRLTTPSWSTFLTPVRWIIEYSSMDAWPGERMNRSHPSERS